MADIHPLRAPAPIDLINNLAIAQYGLTEIERRLCALAAIEQMLRVPVPDDSKADGGNIHHVWRSDLSELLNLVWCSLEDKLNFVAKLTEVSLGQAQEMQQ